MTVFLIDGYNLIHQLLGHHRTNFDWEEERRRLVDQIASYMGSTADRAIIVFDSKAHALQKTESATANVQVYYGSFSLSADSIIEREAYALHAGEKVVVVSSDYGVQKVVFRPNVVRESSRQFAADLQDYTKKIANAPNCITIGNRVEDKLEPETLAKLRAIRDEGRESTGLPAKSPRSEQGS